MTKRKAGQKSGYLGHRTHGRGNCKNRRGSGNRGGRGKAGMCKHKGTMKEAVGYFGKVGFVRPSASASVKVAHLYDINQKALGNELEKKGGKYHFDFEGKVLATGKVSVPLVIRAASWSKNVEKKLGQAGGQISKLEAAKDAPAKAE
ncbi:uL15 family ribosomal protein [Candidatus Micrarchaeota archaeon]|nr:uL15 family ribosomal protein [Candidatus Micrarchaeota archaeon]